MNKKQTLENYYYNVKNPVAYGSKEKRYRVLQRKYPRQYSRRYIKNFLHRVDSYSILKQARRKFKTARVRVTSIDEQFDADLTSVQNIADENDNVKYLLFVIDIFSRYLFIEPLKNKTSKSILDGIKNIFRVRKPLKFRTDKGGEFVNKDLNKYMCGNKVYFLHYAEPTEC